MVIIDLNEALTRVEYVFYNDPEHPLFTRPVDVERQRYICSKFLL